MHFSGSQCYMLPWQFSDVDEIDEVFGGDPWPYGIEANRPTLDALVQYMVEQHFIASAIAVEDLFVPLPDGELPELRLAGKRVHQPRDRERRRR